MRNAIFGGLILASALLGQPRLEFEVASVKPSGPTPADYRSRPAEGSITGGPATPDPTRMTFSRVPLQNLLMTAFDVSYDQLSGPAWVNAGPDTAQRFDIVVTVPLGTTKEQVPEMLKNLLAERLKMTFHIQKKDFDVFELSIAKAGSKLKVAEEASGPLPPVTQPRPGPDGFAELPAGREAFVNLLGTDYYDHVSARMVSIDRIRGLVMRENLGAPHYIDRTGLTGRYDFKFAYTEGNLAGALEKDLGLKLEKKKATLDLVVIDHIERVPTEN